MNGFVSSADFAEDIIFEVDFVGRDGSMVYNTRLRTLEITMHGVPFNANHMSGLTLAHNIKQCLLQSKGLQRVDLSTVNEVRLCCCWGAFGGALSVAQVLSNALQKTVRAYEWRYSPFGAAGAYDSKSRLFFPMSNNIVKENAHKFLHVTSDSIWLPIKRIIKR